MRQPIKLNESYITRILRQVISENVKGEKFLKAVDGDNDGDYDDWDGTDEKAIENVIRSIKSMDEYNEINNYVTRKTGKNIIYWVTSETSQQQQDVLLCQLHTLGVKGTGKTKEFCGSNVYKNISCNTYFKSISNLDDMFDLWVKKKGNGFAIYTYGGYYICTI